MEPTLREGDCVLVDLWSFRRRLPRPGEIVVARGPGEVDLVKRIAGEPRGGADPYPEPVLRGGPIEPAFVLLGDNPAESGDSRSFGRVPAHRILGRVAFRYWPLSRAGSIE